MSNTSESEDTIREIIAARRAMRPLEAARTLAIISQQQTALMSSARKKTLEEANKRELDTLVASGDLASIKKPKMIDKSMVFDGTTYSKTTVTHEVGNIDNLIKNLPKLGLSNIGLPDKTQLEFNGSTAYAQYWSPKDINFSPHCHFSTSVFHSQIKEEPSPLYVTVTSYLMSTEGKGYPEQTPPYLVYRVSYTVSAESASRNLSDTLPNVDLKQFKEDLTKTFSPFLPVTEKQQHGVEIKSSAISQKLPVHAHHYINNISDGNIIVLYVSLPMNATAQKVNIDKSRHRDLHTVLAAGSSKSGDIIPCIAFRDLHKEGVIVVPNDLVEKPKSPAHRAAFDLNLFFKVLGQGYTVDNLETSTSPRMVDSKQLAVGLQLGANTEKFNQYAALRERVEKRAFGTVDIQILQEDILDQIKNAIEIGGPMSSRIAAQAMALKFNHMLKTQPYVLRPAKCLALDLSKASGKFITAETYPVIVIQKIPAFAHNTLDDMLSEIPDQTYYTAISAVETLLKEVKEDSGCNFLISGLLLIILNTPDKDSNFYDLMLKFINKCDQTNTSRYRFNFQDLEVPALNNGDSDKASTVYFMCVFVSTFLMATDLLLNCSETLGTNAVACFPMEWRLLKDIHEVHDAAWKLLIQKWPHNDLRIANCSKPVYKNISVQSFMCFFAKCQLPKDDELSGKSNDEIKTLAKTYLTTIAEKMRIYYMTDSAEYAAEDKAFSQEWRNWTMGGDMVLDFHTDTFDFFEAEVTLPSEEPSAPAALGQ